MTEYDAGDESAAPDPSAPAAPQRQTEIAWFAALCDDDYEFLGVPNAALASSFAHCSDIVAHAQAGGFDNILLPSGYALGIDSTAFAAGVAHLLKQMRLLLAVRCGELWPPQLARQIATLDQLLRGQLTINIISSELPGETISSTGGPAPMSSSMRYARTLEVMHILSTLLRGQALDHQGEHYQLSVDAPRIAATTQRCPPFYFGGLSDDARNVAAQAADVFLMWPDTLPQLKTVMADLRVRAARYGRQLRFGYRVHIIVREIEGAAREAAARLVNQVTPELGAAIRARSLDNSSAGVRRQAEMRDAADDDGFVEDQLWTGIGRARSGAGAAIVGDPDQVLAKLRSYQALGFESFILSGYPHVAECDLFARYVLPRMAHGSLTFETS